MMSLARRLLETLERGTGLRALVGPGRRFEHEARPREGAPHIATAAIPAEADPPETVGAHIDATELSTLRRELARELDRLAARESAGTPGVE